MFWFKLIILFLISTGSVAEAAPAQTPFLPPQGKTLFLIGGDTEAIADYVRATGQTPAGTTFYTSIQKVEDLQGSGPMDGAALLKSYPDSVIHIGLYMVDGMKGTIAGEYDAHLKTLARWIIVQHARCAREHHKPVMIAESTPWGLYTLKGRMDWFKKIFQFIQDQDIEAFCYFNYDWDKWPMWHGQSMGDGRIEVDPDTKRFWVNEISQKRFLMASKHLFKILGWR